jgi:hypothetical protein
MSSAIIGVGDSHDQGLFPRGLTGASDGPNLDAECCMPVTTRQVENFEGGADDHS